MTTGPDGDDAPKYIPSINNVTHGDTWGMQAGTVHGGVTFNEYRPRTPDLLLRRKTAEEISAAREQFVSPGRFPDAAHVLALHSVVVLCGRGTGRSFAARRLLDDRGATAVADMNQDRSLGSVRRGELEAGTGYIWDASEAGDQPFTDREFVHCAEVFEEVGSFLVILLDKRSQSCATAAMHTVLLSPPPADEVALAAIKRLRPDAVEAPSVTLKSDLADALDDGDPPHKALRAAQLAIDVTDGQIDVARALADLREDVDDAVARWFAEHSMLEHGMAFAVAHLENQPYDEVVSFASRLDLMLRSAELAEGSKPTPRPLFTKSKEALLHDVTATTDLRDHPKHTGLSEETIRFKRQDWAAALLRHIWREYSSAHPVLHAWMCDPDMIHRFPDTTRRTLCVITSEVPAHQPMQIVDELAAQKRLAHRKLAVAVLEHLASDHDRQPLVHQTVADWAKSKSAYRLATAAVACVAPFGHRDIQDALDKLNRIGRSDKVEPQNAVVASVLELLINPDHEEHVVAAVVAWSDPRYRRCGLRMVSLTLALGLTGYGEGLEAVAYEGRHPQHIRQLAQRLFEDTDFADIALDRLVWLAKDSRWEKKPAAELVRLLKLISPNLSWWRRRRTVSTLRARYPHRRSEIARLFRIARTIERRRRPTASP